jgi:HPt (histidine-containing phosphotransfer) domain-containing protein
MASAEGAGGAPRKRVRYYRLRNQLKEKAAGLGAAGGAAQISAQALAAAEAEFARMSEDYPDWVQGHLQRLYEQHKACVERPELRHQHFKQLNEIAHDMKGQGGTFGFPLISQFADSLYGFTRPREEYANAEVDLVKAHIDAMNAVVKGRIKGPGGAIGQQLSETLAKAIERYARPG